MPAGAEYPEARDQAHDDGDGLLGTALFTRAVRKGRSEELTSPQRSEGTVSQAEGTA